MLRSVATAATGLGEELAGLDTRSPRVGSMLPAWREHERSLEEDLWQFTE